MEGTRSRTLSKATENPKDRGPEKEGRGAWGEAYGPSGWGRGERRSSRKVGGKFGVLKAWGEVGERGDFYVFSLRKKKKLMWAQGRWKEQRENLEQRKREEAAWS